MNQTMLFPYKARYVGWVLFVLAIILTYFFYNKSPEFLNITVFAVVDSQFFSETNYFQFVENNIIDEIVGVLFILGLLMISFSREKEEDEFVTQLRLNSLIWAVYFNFFILLISLFTVYGIAFFMFMQINLFSVLIIFILRFRYQLWKFNKSVSHEE